MKGSVMLICFHGIDPLFVRPLQVVRVVAEQCKANRVASLVVDPVLVSTSGHSLGDSEVASALKKRCVCLHCSILLTGRELGSVQMGLAGGVTAS